MNVCACVSTPFTDIYIQLANKPAAAGSLARAMANFEQQGDLDSKHLALECISETNNGRNHLCADTTNDGVTSSFVG